MSKQLFDKFLHNLISDVENFLTPDQRSALSTSDARLLFEAIKSLDAGEDPSIDSFNAVALVKGVVKKHTGASKFSQLYTDASRRQAAFDGFIAANDRCKALNERLKALPRTSDSLLNVIISEAAWLICDWFTLSGFASVPMGRMTNYLRPGPGASRGATGEDFYSKMGESPLTYSSEGIRYLYLKSISRDPIALDCEEHRKRKYGDRDGLALSLLSSVPKEVETDRTTCTEPGLNMMFQLRTGEVLVDVLAHVGIRISTQPEVNQVLASLGSLDNDKDLSWCTIDLKSASDTIYTELVKRLFEYLPDWRDWLFFIRSPATILDPNKDPVELAMMSTMGNGFTFPLQTLIFSAIVETCYNLYGWAPRKRGPAHKHRSTRTFVRPDGTYVSLTTPDRSKVGAKMLQYGVFGDDIVCRRSIYHTLTRALEEVGFIVNLKKSFSKGGFRESCGQDWFKGNPVRPVYVRQLTTVQDRYSAINRLIRWSTRTGIKLPRSVGYLYHTLPVVKNFVPLWEQDNAGIHTPYIIARQKHDVLDIQTASLRKLFADEEGELPDGNMWIYRKDIPIRSKRDFWFYKKNKNTGEKELLARDNVNWSCVMLSILGGYVRGTGLTLRERDVKYKEGVYAITPSWGAEFDASRFSGWDGSLDAWNASLRWYHTMVLA